MRLTNGQLERIEQSIDLVEIDREIFSINTEKPYYWKIIDDKHGLYFGIRKNDSTYIVLRSNIDGTDAAQISHLSFDQVIEKFQTWLKEVKTELNIQLNTKMKSEPNDQEIQKLFNLRNRIIKIFEAPDWTDLGILTSTSDIIEKDPRLLRSLRWGDDDYPERARIVLSAIISRAKENLPKIEKFIRDKELDPLSSSNISEYEKIVVSNLKTSEIFKIPNSGIEKTKIAVMMPFSHELNPVSEKIKSVCSKHNLKCYRADDIWENQTIIQDVFDLIYTSQIVIADFTGKNPNVFYEVGIAHTLGKTVIPLTQSIDDIPFDLNHHRTLKYLLNKEGLDSMASELEKRLQKLLKIDDF